MGYAGFISSTEGLLALALGDGGAPAGHNATRPGSRGFGVWGLGFGFFGKVLTGLQTAFNFTVCVGLLSRLIWGFVGVVRV